MKLSGDEATYFFSYDNRLYYPYQFGGFFVVFIWFGLVVLGFELRASRMLASSLPLEPHPKQSIPMINSQILILIF
jgi:hypothetical protein